MKPSAARFLALVFAAFASAFQALPAKLAPQAAPSGVGASGAAPSGVAPSVAAPADAPPAIEPYAGTVREGRAELQRLAEAAQHDAAAKLAASVLAKPEFERESESERAEFWFATGVARGAAMAFEEAAEATHAARGLAGSSQLGLAAAYNAGTFRLLRAEELRLEIPEVREALKLPPQNAGPAGAMGGLGGPTGTAPGGGEGPDPLDVARAAYQLARADLVDRWRADPSHADTRANLELVQRRLRELDQLQREREQKQQDQQDQQKQDPNQKQEPQKDSQKNPQQDEQQDPNQDPQQDPQQQEPPKDEAQDQQPEPKPEDAEKPQPDENEKQQNPESKDQADPAQPQDERTLTPEEVQRLLQQLEKIDEQAEQVQAALRRARRVPVKKDW